MNLKDKNDLMALLNKTKDIYQNISRQIHWSAADSEMLDNLMNSKEWQKSVGQRIQSAAKSPIAIEILPLFLNYKAWQRTKAVYSFHLELIDDLSHTEDTCLRTTLLERLPFKDMLLFFPEGSLPKHEDEELAGVYIHMEKHLEFQWVMFNYIDRIHSKNWDTYPGVGLAFPIQDGMKISEIFETKHYLDWLAAYKQRSVYVEHKTEKEVEARMLEERRVLNTIINLMYYLSSKNADIHEIKNIKKKSKTPAKSKDDSTPVVKQHEVGAKYAEIVYRKMKEDAAATKGDEETGAEVKDDQVVVRTLRSSGKRRPHARKAHWQHYWTGKGRTTLEVRWISDLFVGANCDEQAVIVYDIQKDSLKGKKNPNASKKKKKQ